MKLKVKMGATPADIKLFTEDEQEIEDVQRVEIYVNKIKNEATVVVMLKSPILEVVSTP